MHVEINRLYDIKRKYILHIIEILKKILNILSEVITKVLKTKKKGCYKKSEKICGDKLFVKKK